MAHGVKLEAVHRRTAVLMLMVAASVLAAHEADAAEPAQPSGHVTVARDIPARNAFRVGSPGTPTTVATAREDVVVANTRWPVAGAGAGPDALPDSALQAIGTQAPVVSLQSTNTLASPIANVTPGPGRASPAQGMQVIGAVMPGASGGARGMASVGNVLSSMPGLK